MTRPRSHGRDRLPNQYHGRWNLPVRDGRRLAAPVDRGSYALAPGTADDTVWTCVLLSAVTEFWRCDDVATAIVRRLVSHYGPDIVIAQSGGNDIDHAEATGDAEERDALLAE